RSDLVSDLRAPTPSAAAELVAPDIAALRRAIAALDRRGRQTVVARLTHARASAASAEMRMTTALARQLSTRRDRLDALTSRLNALSPYATLSRGYAIVESEGHVLHDATQTSPGAPLRIRLHRGQLTSTVDSVEP